VKYGVGTFAKDVEVIQVVRTNIATRGEGIEDDPVRRITQYWSLDGELLAEVDSWASERGVLNA
jgi:hypothetical protein